MRVTSFFVRGFAGVVVAAVCIVSLAGCAEDGDHGTVAAPNPTPSAAPAPTDRQQQIPGTHISLRVPAGLEIDPTLPGLARPNSRTSIVVLDEQRPPNATPDEVLDGLERGFRDESRSARTGLELNDDLQRQQIAGRPGLLVTGSQSQGGETYRKVLAAVATDDSTILMTGTLEPADQLSPDEMATTLRQARWNPVRAPQDFGFVVTPAPGYQQVPSSALMFTLGGAGQRDTPRFLATPSTGPAKVAEEQRRGTAEQRFRQFPGNPVPTAIVETTIDGLPGWEIVGESSTAAVYSVLVFTADGYVLLSGSQPKAAPDQIPAFRQMAESLRIRR